MRKVILHIGPHKTGSTYLQKKLFENRSTLIEGGFDYPDLGLNQWGHHKIPELILNNRRRKASLLSKEIKRGDSNIILSSENFDRLDVASVNFLKNEFSGFQIHIVYVHRRVDDILVSSWQEHIKHGGVTTWQEYFLSQVLKPLSSEALSGLEILRRYSNAFGKQNVSVLNFDTIREQQLDLFEEFAKCCDLHDVDLIYKRELVNNSMDFRTVELIRILNYLYEIKYGKPYHFLRDAILRYIGINKGDEGVAFLLEQIGAHVKEFALSPSFIFDHLKTEFYNEFRENFFGELSIGVDVGRSYSLPNSPPVLDSSMVKTVNDLLEKVVSTMRK